MSPRLTVLATAASAATLLLLGACGTPTSAPASAPAPPGGRSEESSATRPLNDGDLPLPTGYKSWTRSVTALQRPDARQVRDIYMNKTARATPAGGGFPHGAVFVMENYAAAANPDGTLKTGADGKLVKGELLRIFVMANGVGWGQSVPEGLRNGNWVYSAYLPSGQRSNDNLLTCRACHLSQASKDFLFRHDDHARQRGPAVQSMVPTALAVPWRADDAAAAAALVAKTAH